MTAATLDPTWPTNLRGTKCADCSEPAYSRKGVFARASRDDDEAGIWQPQCPACHIAGGNCLTPSLCKAAEPMPEEYKERLRQMAAKRAPRTTSAGGRQMEPGTKLVGQYKGVEYTAEAVMTKDGLRYRLADGQEFKSPSAAGAAVIGHSCNGWAFWMRA